jgi:hypothetical protein
MNVMYYMFRFRLMVWLVLIIFFVTGCASPSMKVWTIRTSSTPIPPSSDLAGIVKGTVALLPTLTPASLRESETGLGLYLGKAIKKIFPAWKVIEEQQMIDLINRHGLIGEYVRLRKGAEQSHILDRELLYEIGKRTGARYVFQPRLAYIFQGMTDRWRVPLVNVLILQTRSARIRLSLQLWDTMRGKLIWSSTAETAMESEAITQDPMFIEDMARPTFVGMLIDFRNKKTSSRYTRLDEFIGNFDGDMSSSNLGGKSNHGKDDNHYSNQD